MLLGVSAPFEVPSFLSSPLPSLPFLHVSPAAAAMAAVAACTMRARCPSHHPIHGRWLPCEMNMPP